MDRRQIEEMEIKILSPYATKARFSKGRRYPEEEDEIRTIFQRDRDRILHSKCFRRLKHKTQVFISPEGDHYRTRLTHTLEVSQIARTMARALDLNEDLIEAMALGHDVGHTPFGHAGEAILQRIRPGFHHAKQSIRQLSLLEHREGSRGGLNLSFEVLDGIEHHSGQAMASTPEGRLLKFADRIAYVNHDIDDALRAGVLSPENLPKESIKVLGQTHSERISRMVSAIISASRDSNDIAMEQETYEASKELRKFMFSNVYTNDLVKGENEKLGPLIENLYKYLIDNPEKMPHDHRAIYSGTPDEDDRASQAIDYIAGMSDDFLIHTYRELFIPKSWSIF